MIATGEKSAAGNSPVFPPAAADIPACAGCGRCCHLVVELRAGDRVPEAFVVTHDATRCMDQRGDGACIALDPATRLCTIYDRRPQTCRDFDRGGERCSQVLAAPARRHP